MAFRLIPKEESFFDLFEQLADILFNAAGFLVEATERFETLPENAKRIERLEHDGDQVTHDIMARLNRTFITPLDREDIHRLASALDDVLDHMEAVTERFILFKITAIMPAAWEIASSQTGSSSGCLKTYRRDQPAPLRRTDSTRSSRAEGARSERQEAGISRTCDLLRIGRPRARTAGFRCGVRRRIPGRGHRCRVVAPRPRTAAHRRRDVPRRAGGLPRSPLGCPGP